MTTAEWIVLSRQVAVAWPRQPLTDAEDRLYFDVVQGLTSDNVANGILRLVRDGAAGRPSPGDLYQASAPAVPSRLVVDVSRTPLPHRPLPVAQPIARSPTVMMSGRITRGPGAALAAPPGTPGIATASLVLGIVAIVVPICGVVAVVLGGVALNQVQRMPGQPGRGQATAGLVLGIVFTAIWAWLFVMIVSAGA